MSKDWNYDQVGKVGRPPKPSEEVRSPYNDGRQGSPTLQWIFLIGLFIGLIIMIVNLFWGIIKGIYALLTN